MSDYGLNQSNVTGHHLHFAGNSKALQKYRYLDLSLPAKVQPGGKTSQTSGFMLNG